MSDGNSARLIIDQSSDNGETWSEVHSERVASVVGPGVNLPVSVVGSSVLVMAPSGKDGIGIQRHGARLVYYPKTKGPSVRRDNHRGDEPSVGLGIVLQHNLRYGQIQLCDHERASGEPGWWQVMVVTHTLLKGAGPTYRAQDSLPTGVV